MRATLAGLGMGLPRPGWVQRAGVGGGFELQADGVGVGHGCAVRGGVWDDGEPVGDEKRWGASRERERCVLCGPACDERYAGGERGGVGERERDGAGGEARAGGAESVLADGGERATGDGVELRFWCAVP